MTDVSEVDVPPQTNGFGEDGVDEDDRSKMRPADIDADMREMERRKRVEMIMSSRLFREELERIIETQLKDGSGPAGLLQQISDMMGVQGGRLQNTNFFKSSNCVVPINDIRGVESMGYAKGEKILRCKLAAVYRLMDLYGWTENIYNHITARLNQDQEHFLVNPFGMLYHEITASSLVKVDMQGAVVEQGTTNFGVNMAGFQLHAAVHAARPDIKCIIHLHTPSVLAISSTKCGLLPLCRESIVVGEVSQHNYLGSLHEPEEKEKLARDLGPMNKVMLLTNHGALCCGETIEEAFYNVYNTVLACETQLKLMPIGIENLQLIPDETRKQIYDGARNAPEGTAPPPSQIDKKEKRFRIGGLEFEALMRMMDNAGFRTGYIYRQPLVKGDPPKPRNDVEVPPAVSSLGYLLEEEEMYKNGNWKKYVDGRKSNDRTRWLNSPNVYQKVEILETGTPDPKKITKWVEASAEEWVAEGSPQHSSTPVKIDSALQFVPKNTNPKEFKKVQQLIKENRRADKITSGPQSHILEGVSWEEAKKLQDANISQTGDQVILVGAASKGIIQRGFQHNATVYKAPYAKNPFDQVSDAELEDYKRVIIRKQRGESSYEEDQSESEALSSSAALPPTGIKSPASETEEESRDEHRVLRIETKQVPRPSQAEVVLSDEGDSLESDIPPTQMQRSKSSRYPEKELIKHQNRSNSLGRKQQNNKDLCDCGIDQRLLEDDGFHYERVPQNPSWQFLPQVVKVTSGYVGRPNLCKFVTLSADTLPLGNKNVCFNVSKKSACDVVNSGIQENSLKNNFQQNENSGMSKLVKELRTKKIQLQLARMKFLKGETTSTSDSDCESSVHKRKKIDVHKEIIVNRTLKSQLESMKSCKEDDYANCSLEEINYNSNYKATEGSYLTPLLPLNKNELGFKQVNNSNYSPCYGENVASVRKDGNNSHGTTSPKPRTQYQQTHSVNDIKEDETLRNMPIFYGLKDSPVITNTNNLKPKRTFLVNNPIDDEGSCFDKTKVIVQNLQSDFEEGNPSYKLNYDNFIDTMFEEECCHEKNVDSRKIYESKCIFGNNLRQMETNIGVSNHILNSNTNDYFTSANQINNTFYYQSKIPKQSADYCCQDSMVQNLNNFGLDQNCKKFKVNEIETECGEQSCELVNQERECMTYQEEFFNHQTILQQYYDNDKISIDYEEDSRNLEDFYSCEESFERYMYDRYYSNEGLQTKENIISISNRIINDEFDPRFNYGSSYFDNLETISVIKYIINIMFQEIDKKAENDSWTNAMFDYDMINDNCVHSSNSCKDINISEEIYYSLIDNVETDSQKSSELGWVKRANNSVDCNLASFLNLSNSTSGSCETHESITSDIEEQSLQILFSEDSNIRNLFETPTPIVKHKPLEDLNKYNIPSINYQVENNTLEQGIPVNESNLNGAILGGILNTQMCESESRIRLSIISNKNSQEEHSNQQKENSLRGKKGNLKISSNRQLAETTSYNIDCLQDGSNKDISVCFHSVDENTHKSTVSQRKGEKSESNINVSSKCLYQENTSVIGFGNIVITPEEDVIQQKKLSLKRGYENYSKDEISKNKSGTHSSIFDHISSKKATEHFIPLDDSDLNTNLPNKSLYEESSNSVDLNIESNDTSSDMRSVILTQGEEIEGLDSDSNDTVIYNDSFIQENSFFSVHKKNRDINNFKGTENNSHHLEDNPGKASPDNIMKPSHGGVFDGKSFLNFCQIDETETDSNTSVLNQHNFLDDKFCDTTELTIISARDVHINVNETYNILYPKVPIGESYQIDSIFNKMISKKEANLSDKVEGIENEPDPNTQGKSSKQVCNLKTETGNADMNNLNSGKDNLTGSERTSRNKLNKDFEINCEVISVERNLPHEPDAGNKSDIKANVMCSVSQEKLNVGVNDEVSTVVSNIGLAQNNFDKQGKNLQDESSDHVEIILNASCEIITVQRKSPVLSREYQDETDSVVLDNSIHNDSIKQEGSLEDDIKSSPSFFGFENLFQEKPKVESGYFRHDWINEISVNNSSLSEDLESNLPKRGNDAVISSKSPALPEISQNYSKIVKFSGSNFNNFLKENEKTMLEYESEYGTVIPNIEKFFEEESVLEVEYWKHTLRSGMTDAENDCFDNDDLKIFSREHDDGNIEIESSLLISNMKTMVQSEPIGEPVLNEINQELAENCFNKSIEIAVYCKENDLMLQNDDSEERIILEELNVREELTFDNETLDTETRSLFISAHKSVVGREDCVNEHSSVKPKVCIDNLLHAKDGQLYRVKSEDSFNTEGVDSLPTQNRKSFPSNGDFESDSTSLSGDLNSDVEQESLSYQEDFNIPQGTQDLNNYLGDEFENGCFEIPLPTSFQSDREPYYQQAETIITPPSLSPESDSLNYKVVFPIGKPVFSPDDLFIHSSSDNNFHKRNRSLSDPSFNSSQDTSNLSDRFNVEIKIPSFIVCEPAKSILKIRKSQSVFQESSADTMFARPTNVNGIRYSKCDGSGELNSPLRHRFCFAGKVSDSTSSCESPYLSQLRGFEQIPQSSPIVFNNIHIVDKKDNCFDDLNENVCHNPTFLETKHIDSEVLETEINTEISSCFYKINNVNRSESLRSYTNTDFCSFQNTRPDEDGEISGYEGDNDETNLVGTCIWFHFMNLPELFTESSNTDGSLVDSYVSEVHESEVLKNNESLLNIVTELENSDWVNFDDSLNVKPLLDLSLGRNLIDEADLSYIAAASVDEDFSGDSREITYSSVLYSHNPNKEIVSNDNSPSRAPLYQRNCCPYTPLSCRNSSTLSPIPESEIENDK